MSIDTTSSAVSFEYLPQDTVLTGLESVTIAATPQTLTDRSGVMWSEQDDELGPARLATFRLHPGGPRFSLRFYEDAPFPGVILSSDANARDADVDLLLACLGVEEDEIIDRVPVRAARVSTNSTEDPSARHPKRRGARGRPSVGARSAPTEIRRATADLSSKAALVQAVAADTGLSQAVSARAVESLLDTVTEALEKGDEVSIAGFGKFSVVHRAARHGVNPQTGERIKIEASKAPRFTPGASLKRTVGRKGG